MRKVLVLVPFPMTPEQLDLRRAQARAAELPPDIEAPLIRVKISPLVAAKPLSQKPTS